MGAALGAAFLFGASTPLAKPLTADMPAMLLAGVLYLGSGIGLAAVRLLRDGTWRPPEMTRAEWRWLAAAIAAGGMVAPVLLMAGLSHTSAGTASLLLNLEAVITAVIAWVIFKESADCRLVFGMLLIVAGGAMLSWPAQDAGTGDARGPVLIASACLCWAVDNNLTRKVSACDAVYVAALKGLTAGSFNTGLALAAGAQLPSWGSLAPALLIGFLGYGVSLVLFVLALRGLGTARTGAYFSTAPFIGAALAVGAFGEDTGTAFWIAAALMASGVWLHLTEQHAHRHTHEPLSHSHAHRHDEHHRHDHDARWDGREPHTHAHRHEPLVHSHPHHPDIHHRHDHAKPS